MRSSSTLRFVFGSMIGITFLLRGAGGSSLGACAWGCGVGTEKIMYSE